MKRFLIVGALLAAVASPLAAQQESARAPADTAATIAQVPAAAPTAQASTDQTSGPRLRAEFRPAQTAQSNNAAPMYQGSNHTIVISTLVLVLAVIIIVLLVAR